MVFWIRFLLEIRQRWLWTYPPRNDHMSPAKACLSLKMFILSFQAGIWTRSLEGKLFPLKYIIHPGRWTPGTYTSPMKRKEHDLNQTFIFGYVPAVNLHRLTRKFAFQTAAPSRWLQAPGVQKADAFLSRSEIKWRYCWWFRNPKQPPGMYLYNKTPLNYGIYLPYQLVQDFFHQPYFSTSSSRKWWS